MTSEDNQCAVPRLDYVELWSPDTAAGAVPLGAAFGPTYAATTTGNVDLGLQGDASEATVAPLPVIGVDELDATVAAVLDAEGAINPRPIDFSGGRRFHFREPGGCELAAWTKALDD